MTESNPSSNPTGDPALGASASPPMQAPVMGTPLDYDSSGIEMNKDARTWGMLCHLGALAGFIIPLGNIIGPLIVWQIKKNDYPFVDDQGKESLNFQITVAIAMVVSFLLVFILIGFILLPIVAIGSLVLMIIGGIKANNGERYRYPFAIRLIK